MRPLRNERALRNLETVARALDRFFERRLRACYDRRTREFVGERVDDPQVIVVERREA